jgi:hypothetical protein
MNKTIPSPVQLHSLMAANCYGSNPGKQVTLSSVKNCPFYLFKLWVPALSRCQPLALKFVIKRKFF